MNPPEALPSTPEPTSEELYRQMANDVIFYLMENKTYEYFFCVPESLEEMYNAITTDVVCMLSMEGFKVTAEEGSYVLLNNLEIQFLKLVPNHRIECLWKLQRWTDSMFCKADIKISRLEWMTLVEVTFSGLPTSEIQECEKIWQQDLWTPIKDAFTYKRNLMRWAQSW